MASEFWLLRCLCSALSVELSWCRLKAVAKRGPENFQSAVQIRQISCIHYFICTYIHHQLAYDEPTWWAAARWPDFFRRFLYSHTLQMKLLFSLPCWFCYTYPYMSLDNQMCWRCFLMGRVDQIFVLSFAKMHLSLNLRSRIYLCYNYCNIPDHFWVGLIYCP